MVVGPQFQNFMSLCWLFTWRRAFENFEFYWYPKKSNTTFLNLLFFKVASETKIVLQLVLKRKLKRKYQNKICLPFFFIKNSFGHFWKKKTIKQTLIKK